MFGPADDDLLRQWAAEGRVGADSHVWRNGWPDWRLARDVPEHFPQLAANPTPTAAVELPTEYNAPAPAVDRPPGEASDPASVAARYQRRKRRSKASQQLAAALLGVLVLVLAVVLVFVVRNAAAPPESPQTELTPQSAPDEEAVDEIEVETEEEEPPAE